MHPYRFEPGCGADIHKRKTRHGGEGGSNDISIMGRVRAILFGTWWYQLVRTKIAPYNNTAQTDPRCLQLLTAPTQPNNATVSTHPWMPLYDGTKIGARGHLHKEQRPFMDIILHQR